MQWNSVHLSKKNRSAIYALIGNDLKDTALSEKGKEQKQRSLSQETGIITYPPTLFSLMANGFSFIHLSTLRLFLISSEFPFLFLQLVASFHFSPPWLLQIPQLGSLPHMPRPSPRVEILCSQRNPLKMQLVISFSLNPFVFPLTLGKSPNLITWLIRH